MIAWTLTLVAAAWAAGAAPAARKPVNIWSGVPFVKPPREGGGAASIAMVMRYWMAHGAALQRGRASVTAIQSSLFSPGVHGIPARAMERYFRHSGFRTFAFAGSWSDLGEQVGAGRPLIVCLRESPLDPLHYVVVDGVNEPGQWVWVNDPAQRKLM